MGWYQHVPDWLYPGPIRERGVFSLAKVKVKVTQCVQLFRTPWLTGSSVHGIPQARILEWEFPSPEDLPNPEIKPRSPAFQAGSLPSEPPGKPRNTDVGSLSLLQGICLTQESNRGVLHCRLILYQLSFPRFNPMQIGDGASICLIGFTQD